MPQKTKLFLKDGFEADFDLDADEAAELAATGKVRLSSRWYGQRSRTNTWYSEVSYQAILDRRTAKLERR